jgi:hypothetical protein
MELSGIIAQIDAQISKLQQARALLAGTQTVSAGRGRPKGSKNSTPAAAPAKKAKNATKAKRNLSPEGRKRIADAMKKRWADRRKQIAKA